MDFQFFSGHPVESDRKFFIESKQSMYVHTFRCRYSLKTSYKMKELAICIRTANRSTRTTQLNSQLLEKRDRGSFLTNLARLVSPSEIGF